MTNQFLITNIEKDQSRFKQKIDLENDLALSFSLDPSKYYYDAKEKEGVFIFGYVLNRLSEDDDYPTPLDLWHRLQSESFSNSLVGLKGIFTIVLIKKGIPTVYSDQLGISKYFYYARSGKILISNSMTNVLSQLPYVELDSNCISEYYIFNYLLNGNTFYKDISHSKPAERLTIFNRLIRSESYFDIHQYLSDGKRLRNERTAFKDIAKTIVRILEQYSGMVDNGISMTLTAGLDSRILLGGLMDSNIGNFSSFTFGKEGSYDVKYAKMIARDNQIQHHHFYPDNIFFSDFDNYANDTFVRGDSLVSIYRSHRLDAYRKAEANTSNILMGLAGSDLVRGVGFDGLILSRIAYHCWNKNSFESYFKEYQPTKRFNASIKIDQSYFLDNKENYSFINNPVKYLFSVIIPLHFSQDILLNQKLGINTFVPFLDIDYLSLLCATNYLNLTNYQNYHLYNKINRIRGLRYSAQLSNELNSELSKYSIGKGYSPKDIISFLPGVFIKSKVFKWNNRQMLKIANFDYGEWFWSYLKNYLSSNEFSFLQNKKKLIENLETRPRTGGELVYLDFVKAINIQKASNFSMLADKLHA